MRPSRAVAAGVVVLALAAAGVVTVDAVAASRMEAELSSRIRPATPGLHAPDVTLGGGPTGRWTDDGELSAVAVRVAGVDRPGLGPVTVEASATDVTPPGETPPDETAPDVTAPRGATGPLVADRVTVSVLVTGDALGHALGLRDVVVGAADDPSLAGGTEHRARVTGTLAGTDTRISAFVDLVVDARGAHLVPVAPATGPAGVPDQDPDLALARTALTLDPEILPLGLAVETLTVRGGTIAASGTDGPAPLDGLARPDH